MYDTDSAVFTVTQQYDTLPRRPTSRNFARGLARRRQLPPNLVATATSYEEVVDNNKSCRRLPQKKINLPPRAVTQ